MSFDQLCHDMRVSDRERLLLLVHLYRFRHESALRKLWTLRPGERLMPRTPKDEDTLEAVEIEFEEKVIEALRVKAKSDRRTVSAQLNTILHGLFFGGNRYVTEYQVNEMVRETIIVECRSQGSFQSAMRAVVNATLAEREKGE